MCSDEAEETWICASCIGESFLSTRIENDLYDMRPTMIDITMGIAAQALQILKTRLRDWCSEPDPVWNSTWPVFEQYLQ
ncbi:Uncharacterised protein [Salmonella enterica subsp. enterica serovar Sanjuan]|uniref:Uncharacterized protein n=1 Tax=Salmonella enterica subsp. enterica serovar Sanjuan TaxID=1160765 RepID=A0A3S4F5X1_SALET|nr:Uncharacterised protein [Salmonella enterica subsp. enterica serovar Sanjuan]